MQYLIRNYINSYQIKLMCVCVVVVMGFAESGPRRGGVGRCNRGYMSVMRAWCCGGRGDAARGPVDRGVSLCRVVVAMRPGRRGGAPCRRCARIRFPGMSICFAGFSW